MNGASSRWYTPYTRRSSGTGSAWSSTLRSQYGYSSVWTMWIPADWRPRRAPPARRGPRGAVPVDDGDLAQLAAAVAFDQLLEGALGGEPLLQQGEAVDPQIR